MNSKKQFTFTLYFALLGTAISYWVFSILMAIAMPNFDNFPLTFAEKADIAKLEAAVLGLNSYTNIGMYISIAVSVIGLLFLMKVLNPLWSQTLKDKIGKIKAVIVALLLTAGIALSIALAEGFYNPIHGVNIVLGIVIVLTFALMWVMAGQGGWAGNMKGFGFASGGLGDIKATALYGAASGIIMLGLVGIYSSAFNDYFKLTVEGLDNSSEVSYKGFMLLAWGFIPMGAFYFGTLASAIYALAPVSATREQRGVALRLPMALILITLVVYGTTYSWADKKYDLGKESIIEAAALDIDELEPRTIVVLGKTPVVDRWELKANYRSFTQWGNVVATEENISKLESYLQSRGGLTIFDKAAKSTIVRIKGTLWQPVRSREAMVENIEQSFLTRAVLLGYLQKGLVDDESRDILEMFMDEEKWSLGKAPLEKIAKTLARHGRMDEAAKYLQKAKDKEGKHEVKFVVPVEVPIKDGEIRGRVIVDGVAPAGNILIGLAAYGSCEDKKNNFVPYIDSYSSSTTLASVVKADTDGAFKFNSLGEGTYAIVLNAEGSVLSSDDDAFTVNGSPGVICISKDNIKANAGTVEISRNK